jgi:hypothetical protein
MPGEVLDGVLPLAERIIGGRFEHSSAVLNCALMMTIDVFHPHHHGMGIFAGTIALFSYSYRAVADIQLRPVICNSQAQGKAECVAKPIDGLANIRIPEHWDDSAPRHRPILEHGSVTESAGYCGAASPGDCASGTSCAMSHWISA